ncbi:MAG: AAA family ATPase [Chloroflexi bacterium]|nr:AAA family ATPase [Chloroflexota bacterium]
MQRIGRVETGVPKLDSLIEGGFPPNSSILVTGPSGTGKTIFCIQFLLHGAKKNQKALYVALEERPCDVRREMTRFGWNLATYEKKGLFLVLDVANPRAMMPSREKYTIQAGFTPETFANRLYEIVSQNKVERVALDSLPALALACHLDKLGQIRKAIHQVNNLLLEAGCTVILVSETSDLTRGATRFGVEEFVATGVIVMTYSEKGPKLTKNMMILKMRGTKHALAKYPYQITDKGIQLQTV